MSISVATRVHRIFRKMERYHAFDESEKTCKVYPVALEPDENSIGVFENIPNQIKDSIIITDKGLYQCLDEDHSKKVQYSDVIDVSYPKLEEKCTAEVLTLYLKNDEPFSLFIKRLSENPRCNDLFEFMRFIDRVKSDLNA